jgi:hypothetical protein
VLDNIVIWIKPEKPNEKSQIHYNHIMYP